MSKIIFVTGATAGYGEAIVRRFAQAGWQVIGCGRRLERLKALEKELNMHALVLDVTQKQDVVSVFRELPPELSAIDVLVNNAGLAVGLEAAQRANIDDWDTMVDTNIKGLLYCTVAALGGMVSRNRGHIVNLGSVAGEFAYSGGNVYCASKAFVHHFTQNLKADLLGTAVRFTNIEPGLSGGTEFSQVRFRGDAQKASAVYEKTVPLTASDIAEAVFWTCNLPEHVNINYISMMPVCQAPGGLSIFRGPK